MNTKILREREREKYDLTAIYQYSTRCIETCR